MSKYRVEWWDTCGAGVRPEGWREDLEWSSERHEEFHDDLEEARAYARRETKEHMTHHRVLDEDDEVVAEFHSEKRDEPHE